MKLRASTIQRKKEKDCANEQSVFIAETGLSYRDFMNTILITYSKLNEIMFSLRFIDLGNALKIVKDSFDTRWP